MVDKMISWMNNNQGFVMCLLTTVYVIATIIIIIYNKKAIKEMKVTREQESRPYIIANLEYNIIHGMQIKVGNHGKMGAKINHLRVEPKLSINLVDNLDFFEGTFLAPNQVIMFEVKNNDKSGKEGFYEVDIEYETLGDSIKVYSEKYQVST